MATTRKTTTRKTTATTAKAQEATVETVEAVQEQPDVKETPVVEIARKKRVEIDRNDLVLVRSAVKGDLIYISKRSSDRFEFNEFGATDYITMGELITMKSTQPRFLKEAWLVIDDEDAIEFLGLTDLYETIFEIGDLEKFFSKSDTEMEKLLTNMPTGYKNTLATKAREMIESGELDSNKKIKLLEDKLDVDLKIFEK